MTTQHFNLFFDDPIEVVNNKPIYRVNKGCYCIAEKREFFESQIDIEGPVFESYDQAEEHALS